MGKYFRKLHPVCLTINIHEREKGLYPTTLRKANILGPNENFHPTSPEFASTGKCFSLLPAAFKKKIRARSDLLLNKSLVGGQSLKSINLTDSDILSNESLQVRIYLILTHKKI